MSRNFIPAALAIGVGIITGYYTFQPSLRDLQSQKERGQQTQQQTQDQQHTPASTPGTHGDNNSK